MSRPDLKPLLLHDDILVRDSIAFHFFESWSRDEDLAPLTLEACRRFGEEASLNLLSFACRFPLGARGLVLALQALAECHPPFVEQWVSLAPLDRIAARADLVRSVVSFRTSTRLSRRAAFRRTAPDELWRRLEALSRRLDGRTAGPRSWDEREDLLEALAALESPEVVEARTDALANVDSPHLRGAIIELTAAVDFPGRSALLLALLDSSDEGMARAAARVLVRSNEASTIPEIVNRYERRSRHFRRFALDVLTSLPSPESGSALERLLGVEKDLAYRGRIFDGLRFRFTAQSESLLREELERPTSAMFPKEIRKALYVFDCVRGVSDASARSYRAELEARGDAEIYFHIPFFDRT